ncbi:MAG: DUF4139 domain-containing protein [Candidatus Cloacimonetes bacterium]|nr:DUF4139 domain-containing protein [Candidatus Cloacimonadota bacterium]MCF7813298.1 DUF4139 domain-containing protein [Candidatus Cloacimonadota bacterium]MCF7867373.1 DUF4139 domain-containing protein [Candidatus Cloacimonadota bacterium]MCF7882807.1 DUF4139 domain-containing protein [Candidatus Cloacimonadota bacterium]
MNKLFCIIIVFSFLSICLADQVTIYNDNFSLVRTSLELDLEKGVQNVFIDDIPSTIESSSVIIKPQNGKIEIFSQNYEYDLANTNQILRKYIGKEVEVISVTDQVFAGILQFNDYQTIGILDSVTNKLTLLNYKEVRNINLAELPANFFLKPTLNWKLKSEKSGKHNIDFSYLCYGMMWEVTYNCVWNAESEKLDINSWVTITNETGKAFQNTKLKLIAGDVNKIPQYRGGRTNEVVYAVDGMKTKSPQFDEKAFHDFHLYTLSENVNINNNQTKQLRLFPIKTVQAEQTYEYKTYSNEVRGIIKFQNSKKNGLGLPLPKGELKLYQKDEADDQLEFIGEDRIDHTPKDEEVKIQTGNAFDLIAETKVTDSRKITKNVSEKDIVVFLKNRSNKDKEIIISHNLSGNWTIEKENVSYKKEDAFNVKFIKILKTGEEAEVTWTERIEY